MTINWKNGTRAMLAVLLAAPVAAMAQSWYVGGTVGEATATEWCSNTTPGVVLTACDEKDSGGKGYVGYWLTPYISLEVNYVSWGKISATTGGVTFGGTNTSWGFNTLAALPLGDFQFFGKLGVLQTTTKSAGGGNNTESHYGVGALYNISKSFALRVEWERADANSLEMVSFGAQFRF